MMQKSLLRLTTEYIRFLALLIIVSTVQLNGVAQINESADSLLENYYASLPDDSMKVSELYNKGFALRTKDIDDAFLYANACLRSAENTRNSYLIAKANNLLGILYFRTGKLEQALQIHQKALALRIEISDKEGIGFSYINSANVLSDLGRKKEAEENYLKALQLFNELNNSKQQANALNNIGILKNENKQFDLARNYFRQALEIAVRLNDYELMAFCYNNIGVTYDFEHNYDEAIGYYEDALELREMMGNEIEIADSYNNIASVAFEKGDLAKAKGLLNKALLICETEQYSEGRLAVFSFFRNLYEKEQRFDSAFYYQKKFYDLQLESLNNEGGEVDIVNSGGVSVEMKRELDELKNSNYLLKYIIGVLIVFLIIAVLNLYKRK